MIKKKTVAGVQAVFSKMIADLEEIQIREEGNVDKARIEIDRAENEARTACAFKFGIGKLLTGE